jgi:hypothetical protein
MTYNLPLAACDPVWAEVSVARINARAANARAAAVGFLKRYLGYSLLLGQHFTIRG